MELTLRFGDWIVTPIEHNNQLWWIPYQLAPLIGRQLPGRYRLPYATELPDVGTVVTTNYLGLWYNRLRIKDPNLGRLIQTLVEHERQWRTAK